MKKEFQFTTKLNQKQLIDDDTIYMGGHFMLIDSQVPKLNKGTLLSFHYALKTYFLAKQSKKILHLGYWSMILVKYAAVKPFAPSMEKI